MRFTSHLFLRVEPDMPVAIAAAAKSRGIGGFEFIRRAIVGSLQLATLKVRETAMRNGETRFSYTLLATRDATLGDVPVAAPPVPEE